MSARASTSRQRSLFCECNSTPCRCWPSTSASAGAPVASSSSSSRPRTKSGSKPPPPSLRPHYAPAQQLPSPLTPGSNAESLHSPQRGYIPPAEYLAGTQYPSPSTSSSRSPLPNQPQLHGLLKAQSILRTPESPAGLRMKWDVRDDPKAAVVLNGHEPELLYEHPASAAYATSPPVPFILIACNDALPWLVPVHAQEGSAGVTIRDVLQAVHDVLYVPIEESMLWLLPSDDDRNRIYHAYRERIARVGDDRRGILAVDWLGEKTQFVCLARDEALAKKRVADKAMWPLAYSLKLKKGALTSDV
ncbi:hypothetical protein BDV93DRAFT_527358 [Ceratobasidium sp. AG-I]|nr:hypothetical protein BDV93DRAFT_527358 [Ceratobasidium sp. AG-I]